MTKSPKTTTTPKTTPEKPHPGFPLYAHRSGQWCIKLRGKAHYFGSWRVDPQGSKAFDRYKHEIPYLIRNEQPPPMAGDGFTLADVVNLWAGKKKERADAGKMTQRAYKNCYALGVAVLRHLGEESPAEVSRDALESLRASFEARLKPETLLNDMNSVVSMFKLANKRGLIERLPDFEDCFERPTARQLRAAQEQTGSRMFSPAEIHKLLKVADHNMRAMILLGLNGALGNSDLSEMTIANFRKEPGWLNYPRHKTAIRRRIPLWKETTAAVNDAIANRRTPQSKEDAPMLFINEHRKSYRDNRSGVNVCHYFTRTTKAAGVTGRTFYDLRRTFQTVADKCLDFVAVTAVMGHAPSRQNMAARYRQTIDDERLVRAVNTVRDWLFNDSANTKRKTSRKGAK